MAGLHFELVSPARLVFSGEVASVILPGIEGEMTVLPQHAPLLSMLKPGLVTMSKDGGGTERIFVRGGFAEINPQGLTILAEVAIAVADLDATALAQQIKDAEEDVGLAKDDETRRRAQESLNYLLDIKAAL